jgi:hypothetical protein
MRTTRAARAALIVPVLFAGFLAACAVGGGGAGDCAFDVPGPDAWNIGAPASYSGTVVSCSNHLGSAGDEDQFLYPVAAGAVTIVCGLEDPGEGEGVHLNVYRDPGTGAPGELIGDIECSGPVVVAAEDLAPGDRILIEVIHNGPGSQAFITTE